MVVLLLMANYAGYRSNIHLSLLFKIPEPLLLLGDMVALVASDMGYEAKAVTHAQEFMDTIDSFKPDTVVIDIVMPEIDGFQIVKWLRDRGCSAKVVVASTANLNYAKLARSLGKGRGLDISVV